MGAGVAFGELLLQAANASVKPSDRAPRTTCLLSPSERLRQTLGAAETSRKAARVG